MSGSSPREQASSQYYNDVKNINPMVENRFADYKPTYGFGDISKQINDIYGGQEGIINRSTNNRINQQQENAASSMASRGITGGSIISDTQSKIASDINRSKSDALANLGINKAGSFADLMKYINREDFTTTGAAQSADFTNLNNLFQKYGIEKSAIGGLDNTTWLNDLFPD